MAIVALLRAAGKTTEYFQVAHYAYIGGGREFCI